MSTLPASHVDLLDRPSFAHLCTLMKDGSPQTSPVWVDRDGDTVVVNTAVGRVKDRNMRRDGRVAISITDPDNPYRALMIRGVVNGIVSDGADAHIDKMAKKYLGQDSYPFRAPGEARVIFRIRVLRASAMG